MSTRRYRGGFPAMPCLAALAAMLATFGAGCGDDGPSTDGPPGPGADARPTDGGMPDARPADARTDAGPTHSITIAAVELHSATHTLADLNITVLPLTFTPDLDQTGGTGVGGCQLFEFSTTGGTGRPPPPAGDIGMITITGHTGTGGSGTGESIAATITCNRNPSAPVVYRCVPPLGSGLPTTADGLIADPAANFFAAGDMMRFRVAGGPANSDQMLDVTFPAAATVAVTVGDLTMINPDQALSFTVECRGADGVTAEACGGIVAANIQSTDNNTGPPSRWVQITCTGIQTATTHTFNVPQNYMQRITTTGTPWTSIRTSTFRAGPITSPGLDLTGQRRFVAGQGVFATTMAAGVPRASPRRQQ